jgi:hypothetical protein
MKVEDLRRAIRNAGIGGACYDLAYRVGVKAVRFSDRQGVSLTVATLERSFLTPEPGFTYGFLDETALRSYAGQSGLELSDAFLDDALREGHRCYGIRMGETLAAYTWYARQPTPLEEHLLLHLDPRWAYAYKGFTVPSFRGRRLLEAGLAMALVAQTNATCLGIVSVIKQNNYSSLKAVHRVGCMDNGRLRAWRLFGRWHLSATPECAPFGVRLALR